MEKYMRMRRLSKPLLTMTSIALAVVLAFGGADVADASGRYEYRFPVTSGTIERGFWHGTWNATATKSYVKIYSVTGTEYCEASQDGSGKWKRTSPRQYSPRQYCEVTDYGGSSVVGDYVKYGIEGV
ncbi:MAG: hypothetical protein PUF97_04370 [Bifidobacteriaceae bacterium]|nr:hypothetical protein [Bifidobacteriaceae bacterium]